MRVHFSPHLQLRLPLPETYELSTTPTNVQHLLQELENEFPRLGSYLLHENGELRQHVQIYLDESFLKDRKSLSDSLDGVESVNLMQALSGG